MIVNYDILSKHIDALGRVAMGRARLRRGALPEEPHAAREAGSRGSSPIAPGVQSGRAPAVYLLTGTPLTNRPRDLFVLLQLVGHPLGRSFLSLREALLRG